MDDSKKFKISKGDKWEKADPSSVRKKHNIMGLRLKKNVD